VYRHGFGSKWRWHLDEVFVNINGNQFYLSHQPFRRRERAMQRFLRLSTLQKFAAIQSSIYNHFNRERHLYSRDYFEQNREAALTEWRGLYAG